jgi:DNA-binding LytR/AlgR family response regulator
MNLHCIIIDDEPVARKVLEEFIQDIDYLTLTGKAENPVKALTLLNDNKVDLIFLDINMPRLNGIDFLKNTKNLPPVILTTAYSEYAVEGFALDVLDYLVKPVSFERFLKATQKAKSYIDLKYQMGKPAKPSQDYFFIKSEQTIEKILYDELLFVEGMLNYVVLHTVSRKLIVYMTIKSMVEQLPADTFIKIHKSYIVNIDKIKGIEGNSIHIGNAKLTISQNLREKVLQTILKDKIIRR